MGRAQWRLSHLRVLRITPRRIARPFFTGPDVQLTEDAPEDLNLRKNLVTD